MPDNYPPLARTDIAPDPTIALARLFKRMWDGEAGRAPKRTIEVMNTLGLIEIAAANGFISLTPLGSAALALAQERAVAARSP